MALPLSRSQVLRGAAWLQANFAPVLARAATGTPVTLPLLYAIACKETFNIWLSRIDSETPERLLACCVGDASGDVPGAPRSAFPVNTQAFRDRFGDEFTELLIAETNTARALRGLSPARMVYKGYGIFQYDLQHVVTREAFFRERQWHGIEACAERVVAELVIKFRASGGDVRGAVRRYNGSGPRAEEYADVVMQFLAWAEGRP